MITNIEVIGKIHYTINTLIINLSGCLPFKLMKSFYNLSAESASGEIIDFNVFRNKICIVSNVASKCKFTKSNYESFTKLVNQFEEKDLKILLFPCNQYLNQESKDIGEIQKFVNNYSSKFVLFNKVNVFGNEKHPVFEYLTTHDKSNSYFGFVKWNFTKWIITKDGQVLKRYGPSTVLTEDDIKPLL